MRAVVILAVVGAACAAPAVLLPYTTGTAFHVPVSYARQHHAQDELGQVNYGFAHPGQAKQEVRDAFGNVAGTYSYLDADNSPVVVHYTAGVNGVQVSSNALPVGPALPDAPALQPTAETPEVLAARAEFQAAFDAAAQGITAQLTPVADTPEVTQAKLAFLEAYNAAAAAAAAAEDDETETEAPVEAVEAEETTEAAEEAEEEEVEEVEAEEIVEAVEEVTEAAVEAEEEASMEEVVAEAAEEAEEEVEAEAAEEAEEEVVAEAAEEEVVELVAPEPVMDTEEVMQARAEFEAAYAAAAAAAAAGTLPEVTVLEGAPEAVMDTEDVGAAKAQFQAAFNAAAAAAAPDFDLDGSVSRYSGYLSTVDGQLSPYYTHALRFGTFAAPFVAPVHHGLINYAPVAAL